MDQKPIGSPKEGRRGSEEAVPGPSVFPSGDPVVSGEFWGSLPPRPARGPLEVLSGGLPPPRSHAPGHSAMSPAPRAHPRSPGPQAALQQALSTSGVLSAQAWAAAPGRPRGVPGARPWAPSSLPDAASDKTGGISAPKTTALSCLLLRNSNLVLQSCGGGKGFVWLRRGGAAPADTGDQGHCGHLGRAGKLGGGDSSGPWG